MTTKPPKRPRDPNQLAKLVVDIATGEGQDAHDSDKIPMAILGKAGGERGGRARADRLTPERRREIALLAARSRWKDHGSDDSNK
ncbi:MAG: histone H1 [Methylocystis sp.]|nr:MAG: histone H1 [Methylocystis sp.]